MDIYGERGQTHEPSFYEEHKRAIIVLAIIVFLLAFMVVAGLIALLSLDPPPQDPQGPDQSFLPGDIDPLDGGMNDWTYNGMKMEELMFGHFYNREESYFRADTKSYVLPINVKADAINYYDVSRKIDLSDYVEDINRDGFRIINNPFENADDFLSVYQELLRNEIPIIITNDYLMYYYQNNLKNVYDEIESNNFYKNTWDIYKRLFDIASNRYETNLAKQGVSNDPILEGQRLETAYLSILLELLSPEPSQVVEKKSLNQADSFDSDEADYYSFSLPDYLKEDVLRELELIDEGQGMNYSPVFRYARDYSVFKVPSELKRDAKNNNFFLARKWLNSVFPLYFRGDDCPECLLDKNDWLINMSAAAHLAKDISSDQGIKNRWAIMYKFIAYFKGLRQDLTYLEYDQAFNAVYGEDYDLNKIFNRESFDDIAIFELQSEIEKNNFSVIEGAYDRSQGKSPKVGMRILQEDYWPNEYFFDQLIGDKIVSTVSKEDKMYQFTRCSTYRCSGTGMDILNLVSPIDYSPSFKIESDYGSYDYVVKQIRTDLGGFNDFTWNNNVYWSTLDIISSYLNEEKRNYPVYMNSDNWKNYKQLNAALGTWANIHMPKDRYVISNNEVTEFSRARSSCDLPNYVEPGIDFMEEAIARNQMLLDMMEALKISESTSLVVLDTQDVNSNISRALDISKKILTGTKMSYSDCDFIQNLVNFQQVEDPKNKRFNITIDKMAMQERLDGVKLLLVVVNTGEDKIIAVGPVFDYQEKIGFQR